MDHFAWTWRERRVAIACEAIGQGPAELLCLPAFSTISTRAELRPLAERLALLGFRCTLVDWPGFGNSDRRKLDYGPALLRDFLTALADEMPRRFGIIACGHAAGYALTLAHAKPNCVDALVLVAPTWRGPLPTAMGEHRRAAYAWVQRAVRAPLLGELLYRVNTAALVLRMMMRRHVYGEAATATPALIAAKQGVARQRGARFGSAAFVTGALDPLSDRAAFLALRSPLPAPVLLLRGDATPPRSAAEMDAAAALSGVESLSIPGALSPHEEHPEGIAGSIVPFLRRHLGTPRA